MTPSHHRNGAARKQFKYLPFSIALAVALAVISVAAAVFAAAPDQRIRFFPKFTAGDTLRYQVEMRTVFTGNTTTPIENPEGETRLSQTISLLVRLDVIGTFSNAAPVPAPGQEQSRFRATYEKARAQSDSDAFNPDAPSLEDQYARLEGASVEFTLMPDGRLTNISGLEDVFPTRSESDPFLSWVQSLSTANRTPRDGVSLGQKWSGERALEGFPLTGLSWRTESTYLRDDVCTAPSALSSAVGEHPDAKAPTRACAVLLTHFAIVHRGSPQSDATPDDYRRSGLRTSGSWTGSGESLDTISLSTGLLESATQTSTQKMDYQIASATKASRIHHVGEVQSQSQIRLVSTPNL